jgi:DNA modification methylase
MSAENVLYYGDNLEILRGRDPKGRPYVEDGSVDLVYLDPPFNSNADYNVLFGERGGTRSAAQIRAFEDTWHWDRQAAVACQEMIEAGGRVSEAMQAFRAFLGESDMMAYLAMMAPRLMELRRVLKPTGSIYLHCDPTASHYLKMLMDGIFGPTNFRNEIIWKRTTAHSSANKYAPVHDTLLFYGWDKRTWNSPRVPYEEEYLDHYYRFDDGDGRLYWRADLCAAGVREGRSGVPWRDIDPAKKGMHWKYTVEKLDELDAEGRIYWPKRGTMPQYKRYREELKGKAVPDIWDDVNRINPVGKERLGYPTQKPKALLERIILASSNKGDLVLDPFCGCGTTIEAAEELGRRWIGIDVTHLAIGLMKARLTGAFEGRCKYTVIGEPNDAAGAAQLASEDKFQFECWALGLVGARHTEHKKGADRGIDGRLFFHDEGPGGATKQIILSVKGGGTGAADVRDLVGVLETEHAQIGVLLSLHEPTVPMRKAAASVGFYHSNMTQRNHPRIQLLTIEELLGGKGIDYPGQASNVTLKRAPVVRTRGAENLSLDFGAPPVADIAKPQRKTTRKPAKKR